MASAVSVLIAVALAWCASSQEPSGDSDALPDVSADMCWVGAWTKEACCQGDETTHPECWDSTFSFSECCPNADCWQGDLFTYEKCCSSSHGPRGNPSCWSGAFNYATCCLANSTGQSWVDVMVAGVETEQFYAMDEFYTDAQYGEDFGYYSTGKVLRSKLGALGEEEETQQFAHFTTYPMALSPHFARVFCRLLFLMWVQLGERTPFRVVEMGAGSGQLAADVQRCVRDNDLGIAPPTWRRWVAAFEYLIMERSPALAKRQRARGLRVVDGDAQSSSSCPPVLAALAASAACSGWADGDAPECVVSDRGTPEAGASVVLSNELLDAFAPVKLRLSLYGSFDVTNCDSWQEVRLVHTISVAALSSLATSVRSPEGVEKLLEDLRGYTQTTFCAMANSTIGKEAQKWLPAETSCLAIVFGLGELLRHIDLGVPAAAHHMRLRLRKDEKMSSRLKEIVQVLDAELQAAVVLPRDFYRQLRHQLRNSPDLEAHFLSVTQTRHVPVTITRRRCGELLWWFSAHEDRVTRLASFYRSLGYPAIHVLVRPGEKHFIDLVDCLLGPTGGFKLSIDYGASFEALAHSLSIEPTNDGVFVPPIPQELMQDLPECHTFWATCAGRIDWTTFVDFTNLAAAGNTLGWRTLFYGPQSLLEHVSRLNLTINGNSYSVPGYPVIKQAPASRHVNSWYGRETLASERETDGWVQRWTSFKALLLEKPSVKEAPRPVLFPSWHLDTQEMDACWRIDPTTVPLSDWIPRQGKGDARKALEGLTDEVNDNIGREYSLVYEEAQLAVRLVDWLVATEGCESLRPRRAASVAASQGLWKNLHGRLQRTWGRIWGEEVVSRVARRVLERLAKPEAGNAPGQQASPTVCLGQQTYHALCEDPGGGSRMRFTSKA